MTDHFAIGDKTVKNLQIGLATETSFGTGVLGIGFELNEAADELYPNLVSELVNQSFISTKAYSLYLNDFYSSTGNILFGGVDTEKFIGQLAVVPILPDAISANYSSFTVGLTTLSFAASNGTTFDADLSTRSDNSLSCILDSGTTLSYLPDDIATDIFTAVGAYIYTSYYDSTGLALVDCALDLEFTFTFNGTATITVPADELVLDELYQDSVPSEVPFTKTCLFGIQSMGESEEESGGTGGPEGSGSSISDYDFAILGDTFLRSAYVVYDMDNLEIGLAQANLNSTESNIQELTATSTDLSAFSGVASQTASTSSSGTSPASTSTSDGSQSSGTSSSSSDGASGTLPVCLARVRMSSCVASAGILLSFLGLFLLTYPLFQILLPKMQLSAALLRTAACLRSWAFPLRLRCREACCFGYSVRHDYNVDTRQYLYIFKAHLHSIQPNGGSQFCFRKRGRYISRKVMI